MSKRSLWVAWTVVTAMAWVIVPLHLLNASIQTLPEVLPLLVVYTLVGAGLGLATGTFQGLVLRMAGRPVKGWWLDSLTGFALALPLGLVIDVLVELVVWGLKGQTFLAPGSGLFYTPYPLSAIAGGFVAGLVQWRSLRPLFPKAGRKEAALWVAGAWLSICLGAFFARGGYALTLLVILASLLAGAASGGVLVILLAHKEAGTKRKSMASAKVRRSRRAGRVG
jgi:hypothetical protein